MFSELRWLIPSVKQFVAKAIKNNRNIVLITSGGSSVPLERNTVRSLENFSTGKRGAASAEYFLELGYAVIYLFREDTIVPFARHFQQYLSNKIDFEFLNHLRLSPLSLQLDNMDINNDNNINLLYFFLLFLSLFFFFFIFLFKNIWIFRMRVL